MINLAYLENETEREKTASKYPVIKKHKTLFSSKNFSGWLLLLPGLILFGFFVWGPMVMNVIYSFFDGYSLKNFIGFDNYMYIFNDSMFQAALQNTFYYIFWSLLIGFFAPIIIGLLLSEVVLGKSFFRMIIYLPCIISGIAVAFLFKSLYDPEPYAIFNVILKSLGLPTSLFADDPSLAIPLIVVAMTWRGAGGTVLIYLSAIQTIDPSQYEAVRLDGGGLIRRIQYVTWPVLKPTISTLLIMQVISVFQVFYEPMIIGNSNIHSISMMLLSYNYAFSDGKPQLGAAVSVILSLIIIVFTGIYFAVTAYFKRRHDYAA